MECFEIKICRLCNKEGFIFCDINHEVVQKITDLIPNLININDESLLHLTKVCTTCYQIVKTIIFNVENIRDTQKILRIENSMRPKIKKENHQIVEDITRKYTNINVRKISVPKEAEKHEEERAKTEESPAKKPSKEEAHESPVKKLVIIEALPDSSPETPKRKDRAFMCITCSQKFTDFEQMQVHLKSCQISSSNLKCFCGKVFTSKNYLSHHVHTQHKRNKTNHVCKICNKLFSSLLNLENHMSTHNNLKQTVKGSFMCYYCKGRFLDLKALNKHREAEKCGTKVPKET